MYDQYRVIDNIRRQHTGSTARTGRPPVTGRSNWGRWSADDEIGALNLITAQHTASAASLAVTGRVVSLSRVLRHDIVRVPERAGPTIVLTVDGGDYAAGA